jgi:hypothetical protein
MNPQHPMCRAIEPDLLSIAAGETDSAAAGRVGSARGRLPALPGRARALRRAAGRDRLVAARAARGRGRHLGTRAARRAPLGSALTRAASSKAEEV